MNNHTPITESAMLQEMGIDLYSVRDPEFFEATEKHVIVPSDGCKLLLVADIPPNTDELSYLQKILATLPLDLEQAERVMADDLLQVSLDGIEWVWFCGSPSTPVENVNVLNSQPLSLLMNDVEMRRELWNQIKSYKAAQ
jgi:DNA polymerase-3 subunit psi